MNGPVLQQTTAGVILVQLELTNNDPAINLTLASLVFHSKKANVSAFSVFTPSALVELNNGTYQVTVPSSVTDVLGNLFIKVSSPLIKTAISYAYVTNVIPVLPENTPTTADTIGLYGYIVGPSNEPLQGVPVSARVLGAPYTIVESAVSISSLTVVTDSNGYFFLTLLEGATVDIFIPAVNFRRTLVVPAVSSSLFEIP